MSLGSLHLFRLFETKCDAEAFIKTLFPNVCIQDEGSMILSTFNCCIRQGRGSHFGYRSVSLPLVNLCGFGC